MIENKTVHSMTCDFCRDEIHSGETGDEWTKAIFYHSVTIDLPTLWGETAVIHLCTKCQRKMRMLFERAHRHSEGERGVMMLDVDAASIEKTFHADRMAASIQLEGRQPDPCDEFVCDSQRQFAIYF